LAKPDSHAKVCAESSDEGNEMAKLKTYDAYDVPVQLSFEGYSAMTIRVEAESPSQAKQIAFDRYVSWVVVGDPAKVKKEI
jgi:hypothetical protein